MSSLLLQKSGELSELPFCVCFFFLQKTSSSEFYWSDQTGFGASMYVDWASMYVDWEKNALHEFEYVYIINVALIMLIQKGHFTHTFKVAICFSSWNRFDPLPHSSGSDITPLLVTVSHSTMSRIMIPDCSPPLPSTTHTYIYIHSYQVQLRFTGVSDTRPLNLCSAPL